MTGEHPQPPDYAERCVIETALDTTILVEAAAGTGKTTSMVNRMVQLLAEGCCTVGTLAAVTFTRKATAELRDRFRVQLERAAQHAEGDRRTRLYDALGSVEQSFIGTIHSFCARLLRERPVEADVDVAFEELDKDEEYRLRCASWDEHVAGLHATDDPSLAQLDELGLEPAQVRGAYIRFAEFPDVEQWPVSVAVFDDALADDARKELRAYAKYMQDLAPSLPTAVGNDTLMPFFDELPQRLRNTRLAETRELMNILQDIVPLKVIQRNWPDGRTQGRHELDRLEAFRDRYVTPLLEQWRQWRYGPVLNLLQGAVRRYDALRADHGVLSYQDLLMKAAALLRDKPHIRRYFRGRFTHLLVDEFQDTDPIQAEVMLLLTADDPDERDWRRCRPCPGALFIVGDPKQAIYRFRRADIATYNEVREILSGCGRVVGLTTNFRSTGPLIAWFNGVSAELFKEPSEYSPADSPMHPPGAAVDDSQDPPVALLAVPDGLRKGEVNEFEAQVIARTIRDWIDRGVTLDRTPNQINVGAARRVVVPGDFLILTRVRGPLVVYARAMRAVDLPVEVTGGAAVNELDEVALLHTVLAAVVETDNPVALVGALRSELFGISDSVLYRFKKAGGAFNIHVTGDHDGAEGLEAIDEARQRLKQYAGWINGLQPVAAIERIAGHLGLFARAGSGADGPDRAGGFCKAIELLRVASREYWTAADLVRYLWNLVDPANLVKEWHDGAALRPHAEPAVRVMNLHQAKGLEAPIVFLADGSGLAQTGVEMYVERGAATVRGYLQLREQIPNSPGRGTVLAAPEDWEAKADQEKLFKAAEEDRLLYVAATRAASKLVISCPTRRQRWKELVAHVTDAIETPPEIAPPSTVGQALPDGAPGSFADGLNERWASRCTPTYGVDRVKAMTVKGARVGATPGEHGTEWGTVLHLLLEAAMAASGGELEPLAASALLEHDLDPHMASDAVAMVRAVMDSDLWKRARAGNSCLTEVPIEFLHREAADEVDTIVRGVIDLVFREPDGWVIVDYKTDDHSPEAIAGLVEHYTPQVRMYAEAWGRLTGEPVHETGLFFVRTRQYRLVSAAPAAPARQ